MKIRETKCKYQIVHPSILFCLLLLDLNFISKYYDFCYFSGFFLIYSLKNLIFGIYIFPRILSPLLFFYRRVNMLKFYIFILYKYLKEIIKQNEMEGVVKDI